MIRLVGATVGILVVASVLGVMGLAQGEAIPDRRVAEQLQSAVNDGLVTATAQEPTRHGNISDHFTECIALSVGLGEESDAGLFETLAENPHLGPCDRLVPAMHAFEASGSLPIGVSYLRYWHGYSALTRPLVVIFGVDGLRMLAFLALVASIALLGVAVSRVAGFVAASGLLMPLVATSDLLDLPQSASQTLALSTAFLGALVTIEVVRRRLSGERVWFVSLVGGVAFVYIDLLTVVPGAWILPAAVVMLVARVSGQAAKQTLLLGITSGLGWIVGYLGMWTGKWVFSAIVLGGDRVIDDVRDTIGRRMSGDSTLVDDTFGSAIRANFDRWLDQPLTRTVLWISLAIVIGVTAAAVRRDGWRTQAVVGAAALPALVPLIWYEVASNHSQIHEWFTYRSLPIALGVVLLAVLTPTETHQNQPDVHTSSTKPPTSANDHGDASGRASGEDRQIEPLPRWGWSRASARRRQRHERASVTELR